MRRKLRKQRFPGELGYFNSNLDHYKKMKQLLEARQTQVDLLSMRRKAIQDSNRLNYQNEFNRLQGVLENSNPGLHGNSRARLVQRQEELMTLGAKAVDGIV